MFHRVIHNNIVIKAFVNGHSMTITNTLQGVTVNWILGNCPNNSSLCWQRNRVWFMCGFKQKFSNCDWRKTSRSKPHFSKPLTLIQDTATAHVLPTTTKGNYLRHAVTPSRRHAVTLSRCNAVTPSRRHAVTLPRRHIVMQTLTLLSHRTIHSGFAWRTKHTNTNTNINT